MQIAKTILEQLYAGGRMIVWSWGFHDLMSIPEMSDCSGGLRFRVDGRIFQGIVMVKLAWDDTYTIELYGSDIFKPVKSISGIYFDQLTEVIDGYVETP